MRWGLSPGCSEARPLRMKLRVADEVLALYSGGSPGECTGGQRDGSNRHRTKPEKEERHRGKRRQIKVGASGGGTSNMPGAPCGERKDDGEVTGWSFDCNAWHHGRAMSSKMQRFQGNCTRFFRAHALSQAMAEVSQRMSFFRWKRAKTDRRDGSSMTRRNWDSEQKRDRSRRNEAHRKSELCQMQRNSNSPSRLGQKNGGANSEG